jgi:hypothetical protein
MNSGNLVHSTSSSGAAAVRAPIRPANEIRRTTPSVRTAEKAAMQGLKPVGYGLPCAKCKTYYLANLASCPICKSAERVSATLTVPTTHPVEDSHPDGALDEERERFLREFKAKLYAAHMQINPSAYLRCTLADEDEGAHESATVCKTCYDSLQTRVDRFEAALHMDVNEAAQVIYDAVWADTADSKRTYQNAAQALLAEVRKRAGMKLILGPLQSLPH